MRRRCFFTMMLVASAATLRVNRAPAMRSAPPRMQLEPVRVGQTIPDISVELAGSDASLPALKISDALGSGKSILLGMPGAFTPTCNDRHLPGYFRKAEEFKRAGVSTIACVTTNDKYVNARWQADLEECNGVEESPILMLSDARGDLSESLGLIAYLGRGLGVRSKRFAMIVEDGVVRHLAVDEGSELLDTTSAESLLDVVRASGGGIDLPIGPLAGGAAAIALLVAIFNAISDFF